MAKSGILIVSTMDITGIRNVLVAVSHDQVNGTAADRAAKCIRFHCRGDAPPQVVRLNRWGVPFTALWVTSIALGLTITLSYFLPKTAFSFLSGATSLMAMFNWGLIALVHIRFRKANRANGPFRMWGYSWTSYLAFALAVLVAASTWLVPGQRISLVGLVLLFSIFSLVYHIKR